jgi:hypothetical protein
MKLLRALLFQDGTPIATIVFRQNCFENHIYNVKPYFVYINCNGMTTTTRWNKGCLTTLFNAFIDVKEIKYE